MPDSMAKVDSLLGKEVSFTGQLVSMARSEAVARIVRAGGRYVRVPGSSTGLLVAGQASAHLTSSGGVARNMIRYRELKDRGVGIRLIEETEFLRMLEAEDVLADLSRLYTAAQVSRIVETPLSEVRSWVRRGFLRPARVTNRLAWFCFQDILIARDLSRLTASGVPAERIRQSLAEIARWFPKGNGILGKLEAAERSLRVRLEDGGWAEPSGQRLMDFDARSGAPRVSSFPGTAADGRLWFMRAVEAEEQGDLTAAVEGYCKALGDSPDAETLFNLGNVLYELGREGDAAERYLQAIDADRDYAEAWNNLGNSLAALGKLEDAVRAYQKALALEPGYPDAHCNLSTILARLGRGEMAAVHRAECANAFPGEARLVLLRNSSAEDDEEES